MHGAVYERNGPARDVLRVIELPRPEPGPGDVRVKVAASGINPSDVKRRAGAVAGASLPWPRQIPHQDGAGLIDAVGDGGPDERLGERVWVYQAAFERPSGTAAEYVCVPAHRAVPLPADVEFEQGAGLGVPYITAYASLFDADPLAGRCVLVTGGAGAVGNAAVQLASWAGARVVATVSSAEKAGLARAAGAHETVDYRVEDSAAALASAVPDGIDRVVDVALGTNIASYAGHLRPGAQVVAYSREGQPAPLPVRPLMEANIRLRFLLVYHLPEHVLADACTSITAALQAGALTPLPDRRFPLADIVSAHEAVEAGVTGKVLLVPA